MRSLALFASLALLASESVEAARRFPRSVQGNGFLRVSVGTVDRPRRNAKRQDNQAIAWTLENMEFYYAAEVDIGTPPQTVMVLVDTGSSELWVNPDCSTAPTSDQEQECEAFGQYDPGQSETPPIGPFGSEEINYGDPTDISTQTSVNIEYYTDVLAFGDAEITNQTFGVVTESEGQSTGILGLAPDLVSGFDGEEPYSLILNTMAEQGVIGARVFALDLRHSEDDTGAVIYGGLDRSKFIGSLEALPIVPGQQGEFRLGVELDTLGLTVDGEAQNYELDGDDRNVMLDSGTTLSRMHAAAAGPILEAIDAQDDGEGYYYVRCSMRDAGGSIDFGFGSKTVRVPFSDFIIDLGDPNWCAVGIVVTSDQQILGDSVLRAGYFVFDWDNEVIHVAQAANCGDDDIVAVGTGENEISDVTGNCEEDDSIFEGDDSNDDSDSTTTEAPTATGGPLTAITTTYTVTACPEFDNQCETGVVTTQTLQASEPTTTDGGSGSGSGSGNDDDGAGFSIRSATWILGAVSGMALFVNIL